MKETDMLKYIERMEPLLERIEKMEPLFEYIERMEPLLKHIERIERIQPMLNQLDKLERNGLMSEQLYSIINRINYYELNKFSDEYINDLDNMIEKFSSVIK